MWLFFGSFVLSRPYLKNRTPSLWSLMKVKFHEKTQKKNNEPLLIFWVENRHMTWKHTLLWVSKFKWRITKINLLYEIYRILWNTHVLCQQFTLKFNIFGKKYCVSKQTGNFMEDTYKRKRHISLKRLVLLILTNFTIDLFWQKRMYHKRNWEFNKTFQTLQILLRN